MSTNDQPMRLYLDDVRDPPSDGWTIARTAEQARAIMLAGPVAFASLDHDLGICAQCESLTEDSEGNVRVEVHGACGHLRTGYDFALWMAETGRWPLEKPVCHSANPVGRERIEGVIARYYQRPTHHPVPHPTGRGACDPEEPSCCDGCAAAYAAADGPDADARDNEEESETTQ